MTSQATIHILQFLLSALQIACYAFNGVLLAGLVAYAIKKGVSIRLGGKVDE